jgi:hypothetical protein
MVLTRSIFNSMKEKEGLGIIMKKRRKRVFLISRELE